MKEVASGAKVPYSTYQRFEAEKPKMPRDKHLFALAAYFDVPVGRFFSAPPAKPNPQQALKVLAEALGAQALEIPKLKTAEDPLIAEIRGYTEEQREHLKEAMESIRGMALEKKEEKDPSN